MSLSPKAGGVLCVVLCTAALGFTGYTILTEGTFYPTVLAIGAGTLPISLAMAILPTRMLMVPTEVNGRLDYNTNRPKLTALGGSLVVLGLLAGVGLCWYLKMSL